MLKKLFAVLVSALLAVSALVGVSSPAQAAPDHRLVLDSNYFCKTDGEMCNWYEFSIQTKKLFDANYPTDNSSIGASGDDYSFELHNSAGKKVYSGELYGSGADPAGDEWGHKGASYNGDIDLDENSRLPYGQYTLRAKIITGTEDEDCRWLWNSNYTNYYNTCQDPDYSLEPGSTYYLTYSFKWNGKKVTADRQSFSATEKRSATTMTTYTAKKSASHTAKATYTSTQTAKYKYRGKTYTASASATATKTHKVTKTASVKATKLKRTATASAKVTSYHSVADAKKKAGTKATKDAKAAATKKAKSDTDKNAASKAKSMITKKVKDDAKKKAKSKITKKVKADTQKKAKTAALKAAKKKAGVK